MAETSIEWTDAKWNPVAGCTILTAGCTNCYAMRMAARLEAMGVEKYAGLTGRLAVARNGLARFLSIGRLYRFRLKTVWVEKCEVQTETGTSLKCEKMRSLSRRHAAQ